MSQKDRFLTSASRRHGSFHPPEPAYFARSALMSMLVRTPCQVVSSGPIRKELPSVLPPPYPRLGSGGAYLQKRASVSTFPVSVPSLSWKIFGL
jgi:hypothetical protein